MTASSDIIEKLKENIDRLMEINMTERKLSQSLNKEIDKLRGEIKAKEALQDELSSKYKTLQIAKTLVGEERSSQEVKVTIHNLVREIDKCIALLNR